MIYYGDPLVRTSHFLGFTGSSLLKKRVHTVVNLGGVVKRLRRRNSLSRSVFSTAGFFGFWKRRFLQRTADFRRKPQLTLVSF